MSIYTNGNLAVKYEEGKLPNKKIKTKNNFISGREKMFYMFLLLFTIIIASTVISGYASITQSNYELQEVKQAINTVKQENEDLEMQIAELSSPERIINYAQEELGMSLEEDQIIVLSDNSE